MSWYEENVAPFSPASSTVSMMSVGSSDGSPVPSPASPDYNAQYPRYSNIYEERLQPLYTSRTDKPLPQKTNVDNFDPQQQSKFSDALEKCDINELTNILVRSSSLIDINKYNLDGQTPLQAAIVTGQLDLVKQLIRHGADPNMRSRDGWSTLHIAAFYGNSEITQYLLMLKSR